MPGPRGATRTARHTGRHGDLIRGLGGVSRRPLSPPLHHHRCRATTAQKMTTSGIHDAASSGGARGGGRDKRSSEQPHPQQTARVVPDARGAPREPATVAAVQGQPRAHQPHRQHQPDHEDVEVKEEVEDSFEHAGVAGQAGEAGEEVEGQHEQAPGASFDRRWSEEAEAEDEDEDEDEEDEMGEGEGEEENDGDVNWAGGAASVDADAHRSAGVVGVCWAPGLKKWMASTMEGGNKKHLGHHPTEEAAARAIDKYVADGVDPVKRRGSSEFKGVVWVRRCKLTLSNPR